MTLQISLRVFEMKIAVTGGSGFVGAYLVKELKKRSENVINIDINNGMDTTNWEKIKNIKKFDLVFHLAGKSFVPESYKNPREFYYNNVIGTLNILELCRKHNAKIIFTSSYVYGNPRYCPIDEDHPIKGFNPYAQSKIIGENICEGYHRDFNVPVVIIRPFNIYGPGQNINFLIPAIIKQAKEGRIILKSSKPKRDYVYIDDVIDAYIKCLEYDDTSFKIFNIGYGMSHSVLEMAEIVSKNFSNEIKVSFNEEPRKNEIMNTVADISKIKNLLGWKPKIDLNAGIAKIIKRSQ